MDMHMRRWAWLMVLIGTLGLAGTAAAQNSTQETIQVSGGGTLSYTSETFANQQCEIATKPIVVYGSYTVIVDSGFVYTSPSNVVTDFPSNDRVQDTVPVRSTCPGLQYGSSPLVMDTGYGITLSFSAASGTATATGDPTLLIHPKYVVLSVLYAPPGSGSNVTYTNSTVLGTNTSLSKSFTTATSVSTTLTWKFGVGAIGSASVSATWSDAFTQAASSSSTLAVNSTTTYTNEAKGPASSAVGLDHDADQIVVWLNPVSTFAISSAPATGILWQGYTYDTADADGMDIVNIPVGMLDGHIPIPTTLATILARSWARPLSNGDGPGLTQTDFNEIMAADPFSNPSYAFTLNESTNTSTDNRFILTDNVDMQYIPAGVGLQPNQNTYAQSFQTMTQQGMGGTDTHQVGYSIDASASAGAVVSFSADLKASDTLTYTNQWNTLNSTTTTQTASTTIVGPQASDNYTGPGEFWVYQDTVYNTFMFYPGR